MVQQMNVYCHNWVQAMLLQCMHYLLHCLLVTVQQANANCHNWLQAMLLHHLHYLLHRSATVTVQQLAIVQVEYQTDGNARNAWWILLAYGTPPTTTCHLLLLLVFLWYVIGLHAHQFRTGTEAELYQILHVHNLLYFWLYWTLGMKYVEGRRLYKF